MICDFTSLSTVVQSYQEDERMLIFGTLLRAETNRVLIKFLDII